MRFYGSTSTSTARTRRSATRGFTLVEIFLTIILVSIVITGAMAFRYVAALDAHKADIHAGAARVAATLLEGWRETVTPDTYDPVTRYGAQLTIGTSATGPAAPAGFTTQGIYDVVNDHVHYYVTISYKEKTETDPYMLNVAVAWKLDPEASGFLHYNLTSCK